MRKNENGLQWIVTETAQKKLHFPWGAWVVCAVLTVGFCLLLTAAFPSVPYPWWAMTAAAILVQAALLIVYQTRIGNWLVPAGIGALLLDGIGDTIRVSLTDDPVQEVYAARDILKAAGLRKDGVNIVSCPTCGRTRIDLIGLVNRVDEALKNCEKPITVAVMGCVVNGPGEAREADIGIAGGDGWGMIFEKGVQVEKLPYDELLPALLKRIEAL